MTEILHSTILALPTDGKIKRTTSGYVYADINNDYVHKIFPLLKAKEIYKPDYFSRRKNFIGAHISLIYAEENVSVDEKLPAAINEFSIRELITMRIGKILYYALTVNSLEITRIRRAFGLTEKLNFRGHWVEPHITVALQDCSKT